MGLKAALLVVTAGGGAYYAYTMMTSWETGEDGEVTRAHAVPAPITMPHPIASASAAQPEAAGTEDAPAAPEPQPVRNEKLMQMTRAAKSAPAPRPPMQHWLEAHQLA